MAKKKLTRQRNDTNNSLFVEQVDCLKCIYSSIVKFDLIECNRTKFKPTTPATNCKERKVNCVFFEKK